MQKIYIYFMQELSAIIVYAIFAYIIYTNRIELKKYK